MHVVVMQKGIDLALRLYNSKGDLVGGEVDSPNGRFGPEPISEVVPPNVTSRVDYLLVVSSQDDAPVRPDYTVTLEELREAKPEDESYVAGERSFLDAQLKLSQLPEMKSRDDALAAVGPLVKKLEELRSLFHSVGRPEMESRAHSRLGKANLLLGDVRGARTHYEAAASLGADDDPATRADILAELADVYLVTRELPRALAAYDQSAELSHAASDYEKEAETLTYTGTIYFNLSLWSAALEHYERALKLEGVREPKNRSNTLYNLGVVLSARGQKQEALDALRQAERLGGGEPQLTAYLLNSIGYIYAELGQEVAAQEYFDRSLKISSPDHIYLMAEVDSYLYKGLSYYRVGDQKKGYEFSEKALLLLSEPRDDYKRKRANALVNMGQFFFNRGEKARALGFLERALPLQRDVGDRHGMAYTLTDMANIYSAQGDKEKALAYYADALNLRREVGDRQGEVETRYLVALEDLARGHLSEARAHLKAAVDTIEFLRANVASEDLRASYFATSVKVYSLSVDVLMQLDKREPGRGYAEQALEMSESSRARSLLNVLNAAKVNVRQGIDPTLLKEEQELKRKLAVNLSRQKLQPPSAGGLTEAVAALEREAEELLEKLRDLRIKIRNSDPNSAELAEPEPIKTAKIKSLLDADTLLIEFAIGEERSYGWVVSADQQPIPFVLPGRKLVEDATRPVLDIVSAAPPTTAGKGRRARGPADDNGAYEKAARVLSGMLFKDVADKLGTKRLVIIPDGVLQYVPFSALPSLDGAQGSGWEPLLARHEVVIIPSASTLEAIRENLLREERAGGRPAPQLLAMFADPVYTLGRSKGRPIGLSRSGASVSAQVGIELPQLAFAKAEIKEIERVVGKSGNAGRWKLWKDSDVNRENATADVLSSYRIVHYSAHGKLDRSRPESSGIVLSIFDGKGELRPDYFLGLSDVYGLNLTADLVVLGACQSAGGKEIKGEGVVGLTRGFMYAGAPRVVSSLWEVNDFRTAQFMGLFYKNLLENRQTPAAALRATQKTMWQEYKLPPYFWAAFQMQGEWR
ncbi:MAG: CHAT domain-containing protein [Pyrinomonadaceae bacterium]